MFSKILIANRGEVALRINATLSRLGIEAVGVHTASDRSALHVQEIPENYLLHDGNQTGYLDIDQIVAHAVASGAEAIHPGYGFLAENADFAQTCISAGLIFIGPPAKAMTAMAGKISARDYAIRAGVPVVPGIGEASMTNEDLLDACSGLAYPLLVKPAAGGGGKGLHVAHDFKELRDVLPTARRESLSAFGDDTLLIEKYLLRARHIEFQVVADAYGDCTHLGERECSLQRRHQKVIEEAPAPMLSEANREIMGAAAVALTSAIQYQNLGTIEFIVDADTPETFYFMEMNTRLQVEHRVTEMITGLDLVECQLRLASGDSLQDVISRREFKGHAIEARVYAEDPFNHFLPTGGMIGKFIPPDTSNTVIDSAIQDQVLVSSSFDPMLAKISCWGDDRTTALKQLRKALSETVLLGVKTNLDFLSALLALPDVQAANYDTKYLEALDLNPPSPSQTVLSAYAALASESVRTGPWSNDGWRLNGLPPATIAAYVDGGHYDVPIEFGSVAHVDFWRDDNEFWIHNPELGTWCIQASSKRGSATDTLGNEVLSPMPGVVIALNVAPGDHVDVGDPLVVIEAMKMEHVIRANRAGFVASCHIEFGAKVRVGQILLEVREHV